jgi:hypothetical protein
MNDKITETSRTVVSFRGWYPHASLSLVVYVLSGKQWRVTDYVFSNFTERMSRTAERNRGVTRLSNQTGRQ